MTMTYWGLWLGSNMVGSANLKGSATLSVVPGADGTGPTVTTYTPPPTPATSTEEVQKIRFVRDRQGNIQLFASKVVNGAAGLYQTTTMPANGGIITLGTKYKDLYDGYAFDANPLGGFVSTQYSGYCLAYCSPSQLVNYESRVRAVGSPYAPVIYAGVLPVSIKSTRVSVGGFGADVLTTHNDIAQPAIYDYEELIPDVLEVQDTAGSYTEVWDTGKRLTRVPTQWAYEKWHANVYKHEIYQPAIYKEQTYTAAKYERQTWVPPPPYSETYLNRPSIYVDVPKSNSDPVGYCRAQYITPYVSPCSSTPAKSTRRQEISITFYNVTYVGYKRYKVTYDEWKVTCPSGSGYWQNTGQYIYTDNPPAPTSTTQYTLRASSSWTDTGRTVQTDTPPVNTSTIRWVLQTSSSWKDVGSVELDYIPTNTSTDRWTLTKSAYWERLTTNTYADNGPVAPAGYRYYKMSDPLWRAEAATDDASWQRWQVTQPRWVRKCTWHPAGLQTRSVPAYPFWRLLPSTEAVNGRPTRVLLPGGWEPWVPTTLGQTAPAGTEGVNWRKTLRLPAFNVPRLTVSGKSALLLHTDAGTYLAHGANQFIGGWQTTVAYRVSSDVGHFTTAALEDGALASMQVMPVQSWPQAFEAPLCRIREVYDNYQVEEAYKAAETNGTYYAMAGAVIDPASATPYLRAPELYPAKIDANNYGKQIGWHSISFADTSKGGVPQKGTESGGYYVIQTTWSVKFRNRMMSPTIFGADESLDNKVYRIYGTATRDRKIRPGEDGAGKTQITVKDGSWRYLQPGEDQWGKLVIDNTLQAAQSISRVWKSPLFTQGGQVKTALRNPADSWQGDRISAGLNLPFLSGAATPASMRARTATGEARYIVIGELGDGIGHCVVEVSADGSMSLYRPVTKLVGAPRGRIIRIDYPYQTGGDSVGVLVDTYQSGGLRQYAAFGVRNVYTSAGPYLPGSVALLEAIAGPVDHEFAADAIFAGTSCRAVYRDRVTKLLKYVQVPVSL